MGSTPLAIGSRGSALALWQARHIAARLEARGVATRIEVIRTSGDQLQSVALAQAGGKGLFTKEIEEALLAGAIDAAVHSLKDLPAELPAGLTLAAIPGREEARDALVGYRLADLPPNARVGTGSPRRAAQLLALRRDARVRPIRGNVDTRLRKLAAGGYDAILLAAAGLRRLGFAAEIAELLTPGQMCPAPGQGALAVETRVDGAAREICAALHDNASAIAVNAERAVLGALGGGCQLPVGAYAEVVSGQITLMAVAAALDGSRILRAEGRAPIDEAEALGSAVAAELMARGARELLALGNSGSQR